MPDIGFTELIVIAVVLFVIVGPERMPGLLADLSRWLHKGRSLASQVRRELDFEVASLKQELPGEEIQAVKTEVNKIGGSLREAEADLLRRERALNQSLKGPVEPPASPPAATTTTTAAATTTTTEPQKPESA